MTTTVRDRWDRILIRVLQSAIPSHAQLGYDRVYNKDDSGKKKINGLFPLPLGPASARLEDDRSAELKRGRDPCVRYDLRGERLAPSITDIRKQLLPSSDGRRYVAVTRPATPLRRAAADAPSRLARPRGTSDALPRRVPSLQPRRDVVVHKRSRGRSHCRTATRLSKLRSSRLRGPGQKLTLPSTTDNILLQLYSPLIAICT